MNSNAEQSISWTSMKNEFLNSSLKANNSAFTSLHLLKGQLSIWWQAFFLYDFYSHMAQLSQSLTSVINRTAWGQHQDSYPEPLINGSIERDFGIFLDLFHLFCNLLKFFATSLITWAKPNIIFQLVVESISFIDVVDMSLHALDILYLFSVKMQGNSFFTFSFYFSCMFNAWVFKLVSSKCA